LLQLLVVFELDPIELQILSTFEWPQKTRIEFHQINFPYDMSGLVQVEVRSK